MSNPFPLPDDMFATADPVQAYRDLNGQTAEVMAQRIDVAYLLHVEELSNGKSGWIERVAEKIGAGGDKRAKVTISDDVSIFKTLRMPPPYGLGIPRDDIKSYSRSRMRSLAHARAWTLANSQRALEMLADPDGSEEKIREEIKADKNTTLQTDAETFERISFTFTAQDAAYVEEVFRAFELRREYFGDEPYDCKKNMISGRMLTEILTEWMGLSYDDPQGALTEIEIGDGGIDYVPATVSNMDFYLGGRFSPTAEGEREDTNEETLAEPVEDSLEFALSF